MTKAVLAAMQPFKYESKHDDRQWASVARKPRPEGIGPVSHRGSFAANRSTVLDRKVRNREGALTYSSARHRLTLREALVERVYHDEPVWTVDRFRRSRTAKPYTTL